MYCIHLWYSVKCKGPIIPVISPLGHNKPKSNTLKTTSCVSVFFASLGNFLARFFSVLC